MKREDLKAKGLTDEVIDFVMAENGKDINKFKADNENLTAKYKELNDSFTKSSEQLKQLDTFSKENNDLKTLVETLKSDSAKALAEVTNKANARLKSQAIDNYLKGKGAKNLRATRALFDEEQLSKVALKEDGSLDGMDATFDSIYKGNEFMFEEDKSYNFGTGTSTTSKTGGQVESDYDRYRKM